MTSNPNSALLDYYKFLQNTDHGGQIVLPATVECDREVMEYFRGWAKLVYCGPGNSNGYINQTQFINPRLPDQAHVTALKGSISTKKLDHRFPIDLLVDFQHVSDELSKLINVDGSSPEAPAPVFSLIGSSPEETLLEHEIWMWTSGTSNTLLTGQQYKDRVTLLQEMQSSPDRPKALIANGRQRNLAMQELASEVSAQQQKIMTLAHTKARTLEQDMLMEELSRGLQSQLQFLNFRARIFDVNMPTHLQAELAKNHDPEVRAGPRVGEDIYMFRLQNREVLALLEDIDPQKTHEEIMNTWHLQHIRHSGQNSIEVAAAADKKKKSSPVNALHLANSPMCMEMMLSCGQAGQIFELLLTTTNVQTLCSDGGGLLLAALWLDLRTLMKICDFDPHGPAFMPAQEFVQNLPEPAQSTGNEEAIHHWEQLCNKGANVPAGLAAITGPLVARYGTSWGKHFAVQPDKDESYISPNWSSPDQILKKRRLLWTFGATLASDKSLKLRELSVSIQLYSMLPLPQSGHHPTNCFFPASDLPCKKKLSQLERQTKKVFVKTGMTVLTNKPYKAMSIMQSHELKAGMQLADQTFPGYGVAGAKFHELQRKCSSGRGKERAFDILPMLLNNTSYSDMPALQAAFDAARQAMAEYAQVQDTSLLGDYLSKHPILFELVGDHFFNSFEFIRYVHSSRPGATAATFDNNAIAVTSAAIGMGILVNVLEGTVMKPLMENHPQARYLLHAAVQVEQYAPSLVDGVQVSLWWQEHMPWQLDIPPSHQIHFETSGAGSQQESPAQQADQIELGAAAEPLDITLTPLPFLGFNVDEPIVHEEPVPQDSTGYFFSTPPPVPCPYSQGPASVELGPGTPDPPLVEEPFLLGPSGDKVRVPYGDWSQFVHVDTLWSDLPHWVNCPKTLSPHMPHNMQGRLMAIRASDAVDRDEHFLEVLQHAQQKMPILLSHMFSARKELRQHIVYQLELAMLQPTSSADYIINVLAPMLLRLKENYIMQISKAFVLCYGLNLQEAQTEALYLALSDKHWDTDVVQLNVDGSVWVDYACTLPIQVRKSLATTKMLAGTVNPGLQQDDFRLASMFMDGFGMGISERGIQHSISVAHIFQSINHHRQPEEVMVATSNESWGLCNWKFNKPLQLNQDHYDVHEVLSTYGHAIILRQDPGFTCWNKGSPFATGTFVDWSHLTGLGGTRPAMWEVICSALKKYELDTLDLWDCHIQAAIQDVSQILATSGKRASPVSPQHSANMTHQTDFPHTQQPATPPFEPTTALLPLHAPSISGSPPAIHQLQSDIYTQAHSAPMSEADSVSNWTTTQPSGMLPAVQEPMVLVPGTPEDSPDLYNDIPLPESLLPQKSAAARESSISPSSSPVQKKPAPGIYEYPGADPIEEFSDDDFKLHTGLALLEVADSDDPDDPDNTARNTGSGEKQLPQMAPIQPAAHASQPQTQHSHQGLGHAMIVMSVQGLVAGGADDSDDPDNFPLPTPSSAPGKEAALINLPAGQKSGSSGTRKRAATKSSPKVRLHKKAHRDLEE
ncbi:hypothetical protein FRC06_006580 [Ceratobasidium sp. 370]|nr:hypothetical protein FRC06_006580 [Ceratobasidium sp. 370]